MSILTYFDMRYDVWIIDVR